MLLYYLFCFFCIFFDYYCFIFVYVCYIFFFINIFIEYFGNFEVFIDGIILLFKEKGLRGKVGSVLFFDLDKLINVVVGGWVVLVLGRLIGVNVGY